MSKPALGRGLASLLQEETDRGAVNAPGLTPLKEASVGQPAPVPEVVSAATPIGSLQQVPTEVLTPSPNQAASLPTAGQPVSEQKMDLPQAVSANAIQPSPTALASGGGSGGGGGAVGVSNPPTPASPTVPVSATIPGWIIPTLVAGDLVVVLSAILWAAWGRGMGRWPWIAALFAVGCTQAIAALFLARSGTSQGPGPFSGRPPTAAGPAPGIRVRFVEEQPQSRRGDRR
jgi:hypothetical protein